MKRTQTVQKPPLKRLHLTPTPLPISEMPSLHLLPLPLNRTATSPNRLSKRWKRRRRSLPRRPIWEVCSSSRCSSKNRRGSRRRKKRMRTVEVHGDVLSSKSHSLRNSITQLSAVKTTIKKKEKLSNLTQNRLKRRTRMLQAIPISFILIALS